MITPERFFAFCNEAQPPIAVFVSLYYTERFYGGPEEGGWYGSDSRLVASQQFTDADKAQAVVDAMLDNVAQANEDERRRNGEGCLASMAWLDARGLDADFLPPPDGDAKYSVSIEEVKGEGAYCDDRHYS